MTKALDLIENGTEFIVEKVVKSDSRVCTKCIGKAFVPNTIHINNEQLEDIWDLANFEMSQPSSVLINSGIYGGMTGYTTTDNKVLYIPTSDVGVVNDDIVIHRKYENMSYFINSAYRRIKSVWEFRERKDILIYYENHPFIG